MMMMMVMVMVMVSLQFLPTGVTFCLGFFDHQVERQ